ncbi:MAG: hypothetical protein NZ934_02025 [Hadesarchaea archaeon]|nr:hypothetical protein [Hadesarchaea archaeon]
MGAGFIYDRNVPSKSRGKGLALVGAIFGAFSLAPSGSAWIPPTFGFTAVIMGTILLWRGIEKGRGLCHMAILLGATSLVVWTIALILIASS